MVYYPRLCFVHRPYNVRLLPARSSAQSPFALLRCYLKWRDVLRHVRRHYPSFIALTDSCANPNSSHRLRLLIPRVFAGCCQPLLEDGPSRRYLCNLSLDAWPPTPAVSMVHLLVSSHRTSAFPPLGQGRHSTIPSKRLH